jgi:hypothetical protein
MSRWFMQSQRFSVLIFLVHVEWGAQEGDRRIEGAILLSKNGF